MNPRLRAAVATAAHDFSAVWPIESFIAINPLSERESVPFETINDAGLAATRSVEAYRADYRSGRITLHDLELAVRERMPDLAGQPPVTIGTIQTTPAAIAARELADSPVIPVEGRTARRQIDRIDHLTAKWVSAFLDPEPLWQMPGHSDGLYGAFRASAPYDPDLSLRARRRLRALPLSPDEALTAALDGLGVPPEEYAAVFRHDLARLAGWVAHIKWRAQHVGDVDLTSYLALRFTLRLVLGIRPLSPAPAVDALEQPGIADRAAAVARAVLGESRADEQDILTIVRILSAHPVVEHPLTWQRAYELHYRQKLLTSVGSAHPAAAPPAAQVLFCIDPRSEGLRRHLESRPDIETFGVAGFFGVPIRFARHEAAGAINALPALLTPRHAVTESPTSSSRAARRSAGLRVRQGASAALHRTENSTLTPFALAEGVGSFYGIATLSRTLAPRLTAAVRRRITDALSPDIDSTVTIGDAFTPDERAALAEAVLRMTGLRRFAPLVILTGHGSTTTNNLYESSLQCGACGGNPGDSNARAASALFNDPEVRARLAARGILIPEETLFVAALHDTTTDRIRILDRHLIPAGHEAAVRDFDAFQQLAGDALIRERAAALPGASARQSLARLRRRAYDWAEVYPELGLVGNASLIIGPREMTRGVDLERRAFLHSYSAEADPDGSGLESILTAPMVVAQWINHQYYFSSIDPERWGAGTKTIHNAIGSLGVLAGASGDLQQGLPWQSVGWGRDLLHEPMRLLVVVQAPLERIGAIVSRNQVLRNLFDNEWIFLTAREDAGAAWHHYTPTGWRRALAPNTPGESE
jgi:uncharacterized protein YbcC (UPF0753/DUF2309 family)